MDRTSRIGIFICAGILMALFVFTTPPPPKPKPPGALSPAPVTNATPATAAATTTPPSMSSMPSTAPFPAPVVEQVNVLENPALKLTLTSVGAAIKQIELKQHKEGSGTVVLNQDSHSNVLQLNGWPGMDTAGFQVKQSSPESVVYTADLPNGVKWERTYAFGQIPETDAGMSGFLRVTFHKIARHLGRPEDVPLVYTVDVKDTLTNTGATEVVLPSYALSVGRAEPLLVGGHYQSASNQYLGSGWLASKFHLTTVNDFNPGYVPLLGIKTSDGKDAFTTTATDPSPLKWLGVENQFFAVLLTPSADRLIQHATFQCYNPRDEYGKIPYTEAPDIEASASFPEVRIPAWQTVSLDYSLYTGPKDFNRLDALGSDQGELMNYGMFSILIVPMLTILKFWYLIFGNYGWAIIFLTLMIKAITWPLQSIANHSGKRMQALAPKLKELQAKYKEQPEKLQSETFGLYREYGVNPFGGCLPALVQMPVFFSLYFMLMNAVELRGQSFLWVRDLTQPDSVASFTLPFFLPFGMGDHFVLNLLPIMVTGLTMVMMRMTPQIGDPQQAKIAQWMPLIFLFIFYNFAAALSLYYVINNCVSIIQIYRNLKKPLPELKRKPAK